MGRELAENECPGCCGKGCPLPNATKRPGSKLFSCNDCGGVFGKCTLGEVMALVIQEWCECVADKLSRARYYDFIMTDRGNQRTHGWYCRACRKVVQTG